MAARYIGIQLLVLEVKGAFLQGVPAGRGHLHAGAMGHRDNDV